MRYVLAILLVFPVLPTILAANPLNNGETPVNRCSSLRLSESCAPEPLSAEDGVETKRISGNRVAVKRKMVLPAQVPASVHNACQANFETSYYQRNDGVKLSTIIENADCGASSGEFEVRIRTVDESGESLTASFAETWSRTDQNDVQLQRDYPITSGQRLMWARINATAPTSCTCTTTGNN